MTFGTADRRKADVAEGVALAVGHVATRRGNRLGVVAFGDARAARAQAAPGPARAARAARRAAPRARAPTAPARPRSATRVKHAAALARARGLVVVVSDFRGGEDWEGPMRSLRGRHGVMAVEIRDPREQELRRWATLGHGPRDRPPGAGQHVAAQGPRALRGRRAGRARGGRGGVAPGRRRPRRALHGGRLAARVRAPPAPRRGGRARRARRRARPSSRGSPPPRGRRAAPPDREPEPAA